MNNPSYDDFDVWLPTKDLLAFVSSKLENYTWNYSPLKITRQNEKGMILGVLQFGDLYEEIWLLVWLITEFSKTKSDVYCRLVDSDGEFILIEAADFLPEWVNPTNENRRLWIKSGKIYLLPLSVKDTSTVNSKTFKPEYLVSSKMQNMIHRRAKVNIEDLIHHLNILIPRKAAIILEKSPQLISGVVNAFVGRDTRDLKSCTTMNDFPKENVQMVPVRFNRCHFAQVKWGANRKYVIIKQIFSF